MDGTAVFVERDEILFSIKLSDSLLPGLIEYVPAIDALVVTTDDMRIKVFRFVS
jgi:hypothetical protein